MHAAVRLLFEDGGRPLPLHRMGMAPKLHIGQSTSVRFTCASSDG